MPVNQDTVPENQDTVPENQDTVPETHDNVVCRVTSGAQITVPRTYIHFGACSEAID
jgi:hypothetical protein